MKPPTPRRALCIVVTLFAALAVSIALPREARADVAPLAEALTGDAKADYERAKLLYIDGDFVNAYENFRSAYERAHDARLLWNMAACEKNRRRYAKTLVLVRRYTLEAGPQLGDQDRADAAELVKIIEPLTGTLEIVVNEPGAEVAVDGETLGKSPTAPVLVDRGPRKIRVTKPEFTAVEIEHRLDAAAGTVEVKLVKIVHEGKLVVRAPREAAIAVDGTVVGSGSWSGSLVSGGHTLRVTQPKMRPYQTEIVIQDNQTRELPITLEPEPSKGLPLWAWIAGGAVVVGGIVAGGVVIATSGSSTYEGPSGTLGTVQAAWPIRFR